MQKRRIDKQQIFDAAKVIAHMDREPTVAGIRKYLGFTGSETTLHKYLKEWKLKCFKIYDSNCNQEIEQKDIANLKAENQTFVATIAKMEEHNRIVAAEFAKTERKNVELTQKLLQFENQINLLEKELEELKKCKEYLDHSYHDLKEEREVLLGKMEKDKDQLIAALREELSQTHQANLQQIQDVSYRGHDLLMQEKVKVMNLEERVKGLSDELAKLQQQSNEANRIVEPLKTKIKQLEKLIAENITSEQLEEYARKQQVLTNVNSAP